MAVPKHCHMVTLFDSSLTLAVDPANWFSGEAETSARRDGGCAGTRLGASTGMLNGLQPFEPVLAAFLAKYRSKEVKLTATNDMRLTDQDSYDRFLKHRAHFEEVSGDLRKLHLELMHRMQLLGSFTAKQEDMLNTVEAQVVEAIKQNARLQKQAQLQAEIQRVLEDDVHEVLTAKAFLCPVLSRAEHTFRQQVDAAQTDSVRQGAHAAELGARAAALVTIRKSLLDKVPTPTVSLPDHHQDRIATTLAKHNAAMALAKTRLARLCALVAIPSTPLLPNPSTPPTPPTLLLPNSFTRPLPN